MKLYYATKIWLNLLSFSFYACFCAIYLQIWSLNPEVKKWRKKNIPEDLAALSLACGIAYLILAICNLLYAHYAFVLVSFKTKQHPAVDEMRSILNLWNYFSDLAAEIKRSHWDFVVNLLWRNSSVLHCPHSSSWCGFSLVIIWKLLRIPWISSAFSSRSLAVNGCNGHRTLCGFYSLRPATKSESFHTFAKWSTPLWRFLGVFLQIRVQCECDGSGGNQTGCQSNECHGKEVAFKPFPAQIVFARKIGISLQSQSWTLFYAWAGGHSHAWFTSLLCHEIWRLQKSPSKFVYFPAILGTGNRFVLICVSGAIFNPISLQAKRMGEAGIPLPSNWHKISYFHCSLFGYFLGLLTATVSSEVFKAAQPALLYLVPFTLFPLFFMAYLKGDLKSMWHEPFKATDYTKLPKCQEIWKFIQNKYLYFGKSNDIKGTARLGGFCWCVTCGWGLECIIGWVWLLEIFGLGGWLLAGGLWKFCWFTGWSCCE